MTTIEALIISCMLVLFRVAAFIAFMPPMAGKGVPNTVKIGIAVAFTVVLAPLHAGPAAMNLQLAESDAAAWLQLAYLGIRETALGAGLAWLYWWCLDRSGNGAQPGRVNLTNGPAACESGFTGTGSTGRFTFLFTQYSPRHVFRAGPLVRESTADAGMVIANMAIHRSVSGNDGANWTDDCCSRRNHVVYRFGHLAGYDANGSSIQLYVLRNDDAIDCRRCWIPDFPSGYSFFIAVFHDSGSDQKLVLTLKNHRSWRNQINREQKRQHSVGVIMRARKVRSFKVLTLTPQSRCLPVY
jgi:hypothetical protein